MKKTPPIVMIRGGGDLATGVAARLHRSGFRLVITERQQPLAVRRLVALAEAVYSGEVVVEDLRARLVTDVSQVEALWAEGALPVLVDPSANSRRALQPDALVDGRMRKAPPELTREAAPLVVGLGPGFTAGVDCHAVVETNRGHHLGRVYWKGTVQEDTGIPEAVRGYDVDRVLRAPASGLVEAELELGTTVRRGEIVARVDGAEVTAPFEGVLRGLLHDGLEVQQGMKIGDLDPRGVERYCYEISDKALAVGGGVLEAILARPDLRRRLAG